MSKKFTELLYSSVRVPLMVVGVLWVVHIVQVLSRVDFGVLGTLPRQVQGLRGVLLSPLIHSDWEHLLSNSAPMLFLLVMIRLFYNKVANRSFVMIYLLTGITVWLFARNVYHIGASGVVYGLVSFVFWTGIFRRNLKSIVLALIVTFLYSGLFLGVLPNQEGISWESHLIGGLVGIFVAFWYKDYIEKDEESYVPSWESEPQPDQRFFLPRDAFERTKIQRLEDENREEYP